MQPAVQRQQQPSEFCLRYPQDIGTHQFISLEIAVSMLLRATTLAAQTPFVWATIDRPQGESPDVPDV
jgi:hypothetical protein